MTRKGSPLWWHNSLHVRNINTQYYEFSEIKQNVVPLDGIVLILSYLWLLSIAKLEYWILFSHQLMGLFWNKGLWLPGYWDCAGSWRYIFAAAIRFMKIYTILEYFANSVKSIFKNQSEYNPFVGQCLHPLWSELAAQSPKDFPFSVLLWTFSNAWYFLHLHHFGLWAHIPLKYFKYHRSPEGRLMLPSVLQDVKWLSQGDASIAAVTLPETKLIAMDVNRLSLKISLILICLIQPSLGCYDCDYSGMNLVRSICTLYTEMFCQTKPFTELRTGSNC